jgi:soluble lytic murein transglycosylase-like protein
MRQASRIKISKQGSGRILVNAFLAEATALSSVTARITARVRALSGVAIISLGCSLGTAHAQSQSAPTASVAPLSAKKLIRSINVGAPIELTAAKAATWKKAFNHFCRKAASGSVPATSKLAWLTVHGAGTDANTAIASSLFKRAAAHGDANAQALAAIFQDPKDQLPKCMTHPTREFVATKRRAGSVAPHRVAREVNRLARRYKLDPRLVMAIAQIESGFRPQVVSPQQATGLMQLTPATAERFGVKNSRNWVQNLAGGMAYLRWLLAYFEGDVVLVAAAYNSGEGNVNKYAGVPPFQETMDYVAKVRAIYHRDWHPFNARIMSPSPALAQIRKELTRTDETVAAR